MDSFDEICLSNTDLFFRREFFSKPMSLGLGVDQPGPNIPWNDSPELHLSIAGYGNLFGDFTSFFSDNVEDAVTKDTSSALTCSGKLDAPNLVQYCVQEDTYQPRLTDFNDNNASHAPQNASNGTEIEDSRPPPFASSPPTVSNRSFPDSTCLAPAQDGQPKKIPGLESVTPSKPRLRRCGKSRYVSAAEMDARRQRILERNRVAAAKCRNNKKLWQDDLKEDVRQLRITNQQLRCEYTQLLCELESIRDDIKQHIEQHPASNILRDYLDKHSLVWASVASTAPFEAMEAVKYGEEGQLII